MEGNSLFHRIKFEYFLGAMLALIVLLFMVGRQNFFETMNDSFQDSMSDMEKHFRNIYLSEHLRNLSHIINVHALNYSLKKTDNELNLLNDSIHEFHKIKDLMKNQADIKILQSIDEKQTEKIALLMNLSNLPLNQKINRFTSPELEELSDSLSRDFEQLLKNQIHLYQVEQEDLENARAELVRERFIIGIAILLLTLGLSGIVIYFGKKLRLQSQRRLEAIRSRDDVLSIVSHDLKNPLSSIKLHSQMIAKTLASPEPQIDRALKSVDGIQKSAGFMHSLILDLLDLKKMEAGKLQLEIHEENLNDLIAEAESILKPVANTKSIAIENHFPTEPILVRCDRKRVLQILANLISNAVKFTSEGGKVDVTVAKDGNNILLDVADTGSGIPEKDLPHLFKRYWQAKATSKQGTGIGLSIVDGLVRAHGGKIWVESKLQQGTSFHIILPIS